MQKSVRQIHYLCVYAKKFASGHWSLFGTGSEIDVEKYAQGTLGGKWDDAPKLMISNFQLICHPKFQATSLFGTRTIEK